MTSTALCWATVRQASLLELASVGAAAGFTHITVTPGMYASARRTSSDSDLRRRLDHLGVGVAVIDPLIRGLPGAPKPEDVAGPYSDTFAWPEQCAFDAARALGAPIVNVASYMCEPSPREELIGTLQGIAERSARVDLSIALEFMPEGGSITDLGSALALVEAVEAPNLGLMVDTWHHCRSLPPNAPYSLTAAALDAVIAMQVSDAPDSLRSVGKVPVGTDRLLPGEGTIPLDTTIAAILAA